jgi:UDP-N-acetyl-D-mannosaminuronate dehydrogenase
MNKSDESRDENLVNSVVGLGYLGLPFAIAFSEKYDVIGVDTQNWT